MITYKPIIIPGGRRKDGTWPVKIRITFKGVSRRLPTTLVCTDNDLTRSGKIKNANVLHRAGELIAQMRGATENLSPFTLEAWTVDDIVNHIRSNLAAQGFRLDFLSYGRKIAANKSYHTRLYYETAINAFEHFAGTTIDVNSITRRLLQDFASTIGETKAARHLAKLAYIYRSAQDEFNDEDSGMIRIPRHPFTNLPKIRPQGKGQKALCPETFQALLDYPPGNDYERTALSAFFLSFCTMGANLADMYSQKAPVNDTWKYNRKKTGVYVEVSINKEIRTFAGALAEGGESRWWLPALHRYGNADTATHNINKWLSRIAAIVGVEPFTFYAARKTWATTARRLGIEKATVDDALAHVGDYKMADIYAEKNWNLTRKANEEVLAQFRWPDKYRTKKEDTELNK